MWQHAAASAMSLRLALEWCVVCVSAHLLFVSKFAQRLCQVCSADVGAPWTCMNIQFSKLSARLQGSIQSLLINLLDVLPLSSKISVCEESSSSKSPSTDDFGSDRDTDKHAVVDSYIRCLLKNRHRNFCEDQTKFTRSHFLRTNKRFCKIV